MSNQQFGLFQNTPLGAKILINHLSSTSIDPANIRKDPHVCRFILMGWPDQEDKFTPYSSRKSELSLLDGCASRVVVPPSGQKFIHVPS
jgi:hypothetical protein